MGLFKRFSEKTKQSLGMSGGSANWRPTSNSRNVAMIEEARKFAKQLKNLHHEFIDLSKRYEGSMDLMKGVLNSQLPRVYEVTDKGAVPVDREAQIVGSGVSFEVMTASGVELKQKLQTGVLHPLEQWLNVYREIKKKNYKLEELRLELDAQRRTAMSVASHLERAKTKANRLPDEASKSASAGGALPASSKLETAEYKLQTEEDKVTRLTQRFVEREAEVFNAMLQLIRDTGVLKHYAAVALSVFQGAFEASHKAFANVPAPVANSATPESPQLSAGGTPIPQQPGMPSPGAGPAAPSWYNEAKQNVQPLKYDSDDEAN